MPETEKLSPMMRQYKAIKAEYPDCVLFFRLGDFYEMFFEDAKLASKELDLTLTGKSCGQKERAPMCGVPFHTVDTYIAKLVEKGYKAAICEQTEDPGEAKGIVKREVTRIVTPGTLTSSITLNEKENNYLASAYISREGMSVSYCDISTGELCTTERGKGAGLLRDVFNELNRIDAREIIFNRSAEDFTGGEDLKKLTNAFVVIRDDSYYAEKACEEVIKAQFGRSSLYTSGIKDRKLCVLSLGALLSYLLETQKQNLKQLTDFRVLDTGGRMSLDRATLRNLEITETLYDKKVKGSLLGVLDRTGTAMGSRKLKQWLREPLNDVVEINRRLDAVDELTKQPLMENNLKEALKRVYDLERLAGRVGSGSATGRDLLALKNSVSVLPEIKESLEYAGSKMLKELSGEIHDLSAVYDLIERSVREDAPFTVREGGLIKEGFSEGLDRIKFSIKDGKAWIAGLENKERERTGIKNLKVGFNKVFGYYIDVTNSNCASVPADYIRKQTLVNSERYITPELKEMESLVLNAETKINRMEYDLFTEIRGEIQGSIPKIQEASRAVAALDVLCSFAEAGVRLGYVKPVVDESYVLEIEKGRHPVIEQTVSDGIFVSNDAYLDNKDNSMLIITGPNMSGKSTYMRQVALIVLMAQAGSFVPCSRARIGAVDRIFTRVGASDNLVMGQSTFYVEMSELAYILTCSGERSLIILDEIGRGTSTYDGLSIAWAAVDYLCGKKTHIRTLFATHYHELTSLEKETRGVKNFNVEVAEENGNIVFLHKIVPGSAGRSYGIHVAKLAGVPKALLENAENRLYLLESGKSRKQTEREGGRGDDSGEGKQISFFLPAPDPVRERIKGLDLMEITPSQAIKILEELKETINDQGA